MVNFKCHFHGNGTSLQFYTVPNLNLQDLSFHIVYHLFEGEGGHRLAPLLIWAKNTDDTNPLDPLPLIGHGKLAYTCMGSSDSLAFFSRYIQAKGAILGGQSYCMSYDPF